MHARALLLIKDHSRAIPRLNLKALKRDVLDRLDLIDHQRVALAATHNARPVGPGMGRANRDRCKLGSRAIRVGFATAKPQSHDRVIARFDFDEAAGLGKAQPLGERVGARHGRAAIHAVTGRRASNPRRARDLGDRRRTRLGFRRKGERMRGREGPNTQSNQLDFLHHNSVRSLAQTIPRVGLITCRAL